MIRTDIHRPSAIVPADYRFVEMRYTGPNAMEYMDGSVMNARQRLEADMARTGGKYSSHDHGGCCHICGASCMYQAIFHHAATNVYIVTGETCAEKMEFSVEGFSEFRKRIHNARDAYAGKAKAQITLADHGLTAMWDIYSTSMNWTPDKRQEGILREMTLKLIKYGTISEKQVAFAKVLLQQIADRAVIAAQRAAENAQSAHIGTVGQRLVLSLTVTFIASYDTAFGTMFVNGCKDAAGNIVIYKGNKTLADKGETISVKATIKEHGDREGVKQTIIARPTLTPVKA